MGRIALAQNKREGLALIIILYSQGKIFVGNLFLYTTFLRLNILVRFKGILIFVKSFELHNSLKFKVRFHNRKHLVCLETINTFFIWRGLLVIISDWGLLFISILLLECLVKSIPSTNEVKKMRCLFRSEGYDKKTS